jgi:hypothetical protein
VTGLTAHSVSGETPLANGAECGLHRIERLMRLQALRARRPRRRPPKDEGDRQIATVTSGGRFGRAVP